MRYIDSRLHPNWQRDEPSQGGYGGSPQDLEEEAGQTMRDLVRNVQDRSQEQRKQTIESVSHALRERITGSIDTAADYLLHQNPRQMLHDAELFARRQPALFLVAAFSLGVLAGRFLKSSSRRPA